MASSLAPHPNVFVRGIPANWGEAEIAAVFQQYGTLSSIRLVRHSVTKQSLGYGFVRFQSFEDAQSAIAGLDGASVLGQALQVKFADADAGPPASSTLSGLTPSESVYIKHLPANCAAGDVLALFDSRVPPSGAVSAGGTSGMGSHVVDVKLFPCLDALRGGSALVRMSSQEAAERAIAALNNATLPGAAHSLVVRYAESAAEKAARLTRRSAAAAAARGAVVVSPAAAAAAAAAVAGMTIVPPGLGLLAAGGGNGTADPGTGGGAGLAHHHLSLQAALSALTASSAGIAHGGALAPALPPHLPMAYTLPGAGELLRPGLSDGGMPPAALAVLPRTPGLSSAGGEELPGPGISPHTGDDLATGRLPPSRHSPSQHEGPRGESGAAAALGLAGVTGHHPAPLLGAAGMTSSLPATVLLKSAQGPAVLSLAGLGPEHDRLWLYEQFALFGAVLHVARDVDGAAGAASVTFANSADAECAAQAVHAGQLGKPGLSASVGLPPGQGVSHQHLPEQDGWPSRLPEWR